MFALIPPFLKSWAIKAALGGVLVLGALTYGYLKGEQAATAQCNEAALQAEIAALQRDLRAAEFAREAARQFLEAEEARNATLETRIDGYVDQLEVGGACPVDGADLERLRNIARP